MVDRLLTAPDVQQRIERTLADSSKLRTLLAGLQELCSGRRVVVIGSAPGLRVPWPRRGDRVVCVNASVGIANDLGVVPDLMVLAGYTTKPRRPASEASLAFMKNRRTRHLIFIEAGDNFDSAVTTLKDLSFSWRRLTVLDPIERGAVIAACASLKVAIGPRDQRISNGIFAALLPIWANAREVILSGFSLSGGHSYIATGTPRYHVEGDRACLLELAAMRPGLSTTSEQLARHTGLRLRPGWRPRAMSRLGIQLSHQILKLVDR